VITEPDKLPENSQLIHAGTAFNEDRGIITNGGRVLGAVGCGKTLSDAKDSAYALCEMVEYKSKYYRKDIGHNEFSRK
jgi:phosphoribosylamine--glycine ligase